MTNQKAQSLSLNGRLFYFCTMINFILNQQKPDKVIGHLARDYGYKQYEPIKAGTPIYELQGGRCYFEMKFIPNGEIHKQYFKTETLKPDILFHPHPLPDR